MSDEIEQNQKIDEIEKNNGVVEQITKNSVKSKIVKKNPKKIAAGKKLESNSIIKEQNNNVGDETNVSTGMFNGPTLTSVIALIGLGLTAIDLFLRYRNQQNGLKIDENRDEKPVEEIYKDDKKVRFSEPERIAGME